MFRQGFTCPALLEDNDWSTRTGLSPALARLSKRFRFCHRCHWPGPRSLATTCGVSVDVLSSGYLDVSVRRVRLLHLWIHCRIPLRVGCPIRIPTDQCLLAAPHGFSQRATSFIASQCQGIHQMPFLLFFLTAARPPVCRDKPTSRHQAIARSPMSMLARPNPNAVTDGAMAGTNVLGHALYSLFTLSKSPVRSREPPGTDLRPSRPTLPCCGPLPTSPRPSPTQPSPAALLKAAGGGRRDRTDDLLLAKQALSQLSYAPSPSRVCLKPVREQASPDKVLALPADARRPISGGPGRI